MEKFWKIFLAAVLAASLAACGAPTLDTSSDEALKASTEEMMADLSPEDQQRFKQALAGFLMGGVLQQMGSGKSGEEVANDVMKELDGKTAEEIIAMGDEMKEKMKAEFGN